MDSHYPVRALVLCAGYGTRLGNLTHETPKPMLDLCGRPMLEYIVSHLANHGIKDIAINLHFKPEQIENYFGSGENFGVRIHYSPEPSLLGTAGGAKNLEPFLSDTESFLVQYGDIVTDENLTEMIKKHQESDALVTMLLHQRQKSNSIVQMDSSNRITQFLERPDESAYQEGKLYWVNSAIYLCRRDVFNHIPADVECDFPRDIFPSLVTTGKVFGWPLRGYRCAVDSAGRLDTVRTDIKSNRCAISLRKVEKP